jgi:hypothetical protein
MQEGRRGDRKIPLETIGKSTTREQRRNSVEIFVRGGEGRRRECERGGKVIGRYIK